ncbi:MAG: uroporphyrinogen-III C-methyltransferase [Phycisphaerae bacterium]
MNLATGTVYLVGAGPGDPELITVSGLEAIRGADVVVHDRLVSRDLVAEARSEAEIIDAGKAPGEHRYAQSWINALLVDRAKKGRLVVRLKGGDPFVFGRGFEELAACREAGVVCVVIPGVSSALAAPAAAGIPVTTRGRVRSVAIITAQVAVESSGPPLNYRALAAMDTIVILMGRSNLDAVTASLLAAGRDPATPAATIEQATTAGQRVTRATLSTIAQAADRDGLQAPVVTVVGTVAACADDAVCLEYARIAQVDGGVHRAV